MQVLGVYALVQRALELWQTQSVYRVPAQRMLRLYAQCVQHLFAFRPQDFEYIIPQSANHCLLVMELTHRAWNVMRNSGTPGAGTFQEPLSRLYSMLDAQAHQAQQGEVSDGSHCEQSPGGSAEEE